MAIKLLSRGVIIIFCMTLLGCSTDDENLYQDFEDLSLHEKEGIDYDINHQSAHSAVLIMAIHGGSIEPGTSELVQTVSKGSFNYYDFAGMKQTDNYDLHISSLEFDEPEAVKMVEGSKYTVSIHGYESEDKNTYVGGRDTALASNIKNELQKNGFGVTESPKKFAGKEKENITNRNNRSKGVQIEISAAQRKAFFEGGDFTSANRENKTDEFYDYAKAVQKGIKHK